MLLLASISFLQHSAGPAVSRVNAMNVQVCLQALFQRLAATCQTHCIAAAVMFLCRRTAFTATDCLRSTLHHLMRCEEVYSFHCQGCDAAPVLTNCCVRVFSFPSFNACVQPYLYILMQIKIVILLAHFFFRLSLPQVQSCRFTNCASHSNKICFCLS